VSLERAVELQERSWTLQAQGRLDEAFEACREALRLMEQGEESDSPDVANLLTDLAEIEQDRGHLGAALALAERAGSIEDAWTDVFDGETAVRIRMRTLTLIGTIRRMKGDYVRAEGPLLKALTVAATAFGDTSEEGAQAQNNLAVLYKYSGRFDEGVRLYERALASLIAIHGEDSLPCADVFHNLGGILHARSDFSAAEPPARKAWEISRRLMGDVDPRTLRDAVAYAAVLDGLGEYDESEPIYRSALTVYEKVFGSDHEEVAATVHNLAAVLAAKGDVAGAEQHYRRALAMKETLFGDDHPDVALTCNNLGRLLADCGQSVQAVDLLERAVAILEQRLDHGHPHLAAARGNLMKAVGARLS
jgi:tetratricopeptide (TPR) repeat protein